MAIFINKKDAVTVGETLLRCWISQAGLGPMKTFHTDRGREFFNEELTSIGDYLQIKQTSTAAYIPNANGCNERNHAVVDRMMIKMLTSEPDMKSKVAVAWCIDA